jgi:hypothetical protein
MVDDIALTLWRVHEGSEDHVVIAEDERQARGIAFGYRFADPHEWGDTQTMKVEPVSYHAAMRVVLRSEDGEMPATLAVHLSNATGPEYLGGSVW